MKGAVGGAITGGVGAWASSASVNAFAKIIAQSGASGVSSEIMGGEFKDGFKMALVTASARYLYESTVKYKATWESGEEAVSKTSSDTAFEGKNNIGIAGKVNPNSLLGEGGKVSRILNQVPGVNAVAGMHDVMQVGFDRVVGTSDSWLRTVANVPAMVPAVAITYSALAAPYVNTYVVERNTRKQRY
jgi:hypothetical protein